MRNHHVFYDNSIVLWILLFIVVILVIIFLVFLLKRKNQKDDTELSYDEDNVIAQINSMLFQAGGGMNQTEISKALKLPLSVVSSMLKKMENDGSITREWINDEFTFRVKQQ